MYLFFLASAVVELLKLLTFFIIQKLQTNVRPMLPPCINFINLWQNANGKKYKVAMRKLQFVVCQKSFDDVNRVLIFSATSKNFIRKCFVKRLF
jgi:hypothetical protein